MEPDKNDEYQPLLESLGIRPAFVADTGPPVDTEKLRQFLRGELTPLARQEVAACIAGFRDWYRAMVEIHTEPADW
ncbi:MAG: hypothetical protein ACK4RK_19060 [Gemmataceae bacterium]